MDMSCAMMSLNADFCGVQKDAAGNSCAWTNVLGFVDFCLTSGQNSFMSWYIDAMKAEGIDLEGLANGDMSSIMNLMSSEDKKLGDLPEDEILVDDTVVPEEELEMAEPPKSEEIPLDDEIPVHEDAVDALLKAEIKNQMRDEDAN